MATLNVTNLQNVASGNVNISMLSDGTTSLVLSSTGTSRTGGIRYNASAVEVYDGAGWVGVGGSSGGFSTGTRIVFVQSTAPVGWVKETGAAYNDAALRFVTGASGNSTAGTNPFTSTFTSYTPSGSISVTTANTTAGGTVTGTNSSVVATGTVTGTNDNTTATGTLSGNVSPYTLTVADIPAHDHSYEWRNTANGGGAAGVGPLNSFFDVTGLTGGGGSHAHSMAGAIFTGTAHTHTFNGSFTGAAHSHTWNGTFAGTAHNHTVTGAVTGTATTQFAVKYVDAIICTKT
jgi:hypothetical protein